MGEKRSVASEIADRDWWRKAGTIMGWRLYGWSYRTGSIFIDERTAFRHLDGDVAAKLIELSAAADERAAKASEEGR